jgi:hypothetical protein
MGKMAQIRQISKKILAVARLLLFVSVVAKNIERF